MPPLFAALFDWAQKTAAFIPCPTLYVTLPTRLVAYHISLNLSNLHVTFYHNPKPTAIGETLIFNLLQCRHFPTQRLAFSLNHSLQPHSTADHFKTISSQRFPEQFPLRRMLIQRVFESEI
jgi:hypothetical protein